MARVEKNHFVMATCKAFLEANIPIEKLDNLSLRSWMSEYIPGAGDLPSADMMRKTYIPQVREEEEAFMRQKVKDQQISILCDETTDRKGQCVFLVLIKILECSVSSKLYVGGVKILSNANATECGGAIMDVVNKLEISLTNVSCIVTDSAAYMKKCVDSLKVLFGESLVHIQCWAHKLNLVSNIFQINLKELNECILQVKSAFLNTRKRKHAYLAFLQQKYSEGEKKAKLFPSPVATRWNSWHKAAIYVNEYLSDIREFFSLVGEGGSAVHRLSSLTEEEVAIIQCQAAFVVEHCQPIVKLLECLEGAYPYSYKLQSKLIDIGNSLKIVSDGSFGNDTSGLIKNLPKKLAPVLTAALTNAATKAKIKLSQLQHGDTVKGFLHSIGQLFDERFMRSTTNNDIIRASKHLPLMAALSSQVVLEGHAALKSALTKALSNGSEFDLMSELLNLKKDHAEFVHASVKSLSVPVFNVDSECGFSAYTNIVSDRRTTLTPKNVELMLSLTFGD